MGEVVLKPAGIEIEMMKRLLPLEKNALIFNKTSNYLFYILFAIASLISPSRTVTALISSAIAWEASELLKRVFRKERPYRFFRIKLRTSTKPHKAFPSSHSASATALFLCFYPAKISILFLLIPLLRVISFQHWPSDVAAGMSMGALSFALLRLVL